MIHVEGLTKDYGPNRAIDNLRFHADEGEIVGFLGPNGAGKTTTMRILSGYMPPTFGKAEVAGYDVVNQSIEVRRRVGYMPETVPLYPDMTVFDYLKYMADLRHLPGAEGKVDDVIEKLGIEEKEVSYIGTLSKGMRQRVGLAQALIHDPEVLILDEPTIGLDPAQIIEVRNLIREIGRNHTVFLSTHILSEAQQLCNRVMILNKGKIVAEDSPERLQARLTGAQRVTLHVDGDSDGVEGLISAVKGVETIISNQEGHFDFVTVPGQDPRAEVVRSLVNSGYGLLEIRQVGLSLEEIFLELTRDEPQPPSTSQELDSPGELETNHENYQEKE